MNSNHYAHGHNWDKDFAVPKGFGESAASIKRPKRVYTPLQMNSIHCKHEMKRNRVTNKADYLKWMAKTFDVENECQKQLASEIAVS